MSRIGKLPIEIPDKVSITQNENKINVKGPLGELTREFSPDIKIAIDGEKIIISPLKDDIKTHSLHGLSRTLLANMIEGVTKGFSKTLLITGVGYRAAKSGQGLQIQMGFSHPVTVEAVEGIEFEVEGNTKIIVKGTDKELVGQIAANIRSIRPVEPYKSKGMKYDYEIVKKKMGKAGKTA